MSLCSTFAHLPTIEIVDLLQVTWEIQFPQEYKKHNVTRRDLIKMVNFMLIIIKGRQPAFFQDLV